MVEIKDATLPGDIDDVARLWRDYLSWGNDEMESRHGFRLPVEEAVQHDVATIGKFEPRTVVCCWRSRRQGNRNGSDAAHRAGHR